MGRGKKFIHLLSFLVKIQIRRPEILIMVHRRQCTKYIYTTKQAHRNFFPAASSTLKNLSSFRSSWEYFRFTLLKCPQLVCTENSYMLNYKSSKIQIFNFQYSNINFQNPPCVLTSKTFQCSPNTWLQHLRYFF